MRRTLNLAALLAMTFCFAVSAQAEPLLLYTSQPDGDVRTLVEAFAESCPGVSHARAQTPSSVRCTSLVSVEPGPTSTKVSKPCALRP